MNSIVFTGPTLSADEVRAIIDAEVRPPAAFGDIYRAARDQPTAIGLIDGLFQSTPSVWHKEILWAMKQGVHVFGGASMGALRASELHAFGMEGVGEIFEAFRDGVLSDDDEVAVAHADAEHGWRPLSEPMVDLRATLRTAMAAHVISEMEFVELEAIAKRCFYPERSWQRLLRDARLVLPKPRVDALEVWVPTGRVRQKQRDATALLLRMKSFLSSSPESKRVNFYFEHTDAWEDGRRRADLAHVVLRRSLDEALVEELQIAGGFNSARDAAIVRGHAIDEAQRRGLSIDEAGLLAAIDAFRCERDLRKPEEFAGWMVAQGLRDADLARFLCDEVLARLGRLTFEGDVQRHLIDHLRVSGDLQRLNERAGAKARLLAAHGATHPTIADTKMTEMQLALWFFETRLKQPLPRDLRAWAVSSGFEDDRALTQAIVREYLYSLLSEETGPS